ncbi:tyrosine-type recombinase/integrase [Bhargavaea ginsengi]|uniref:tyrosine-type recombinase/integrase n=1 Tax=Bhargavaea ginsengi TaxID=426757 RepID=UPI00203F8FBF|nr:tyrosine-type recombinase/integrase [Bhargavaea ginsengi]MCM3087763.1 tyrosine-type recombinase/integrase [Bhargavaea ginsengi]
MSKKKIVTPSLLAEIERATGRRSKAEAPEPVTFADAVKQFLEYGEMRGLSAHTVSSYAKELKALYAFLIESDAPHADISALEPAHYEAFVKSQLARGFAHSTINTRLRTAKIFGNYCVRKRLIAENAAAEVETLKERRKIGDTFTRQQLNRILAAPNVSTFEGLRDLTIMTTFADTGIRLSELCAIEVQDVKLGDNSLLVQVAKNRYGRRMPLTKRLSALLTAYLKVRGINPFTDALFVTGADRPLSARLVQAQIREHGKRAGIIGEVQCSPHVFRRTFAKFKIQAGVDIFTVQALMGHSDISQLKRYVAVYSQDLDNAIERGIE